jgi:hypothetical protein
MAERGRQPRRKKFTGGAKHRGKMKGKKEGGKYLELYTERNEGGRGRGRKENN